MVREIRLTQSLPDEEADALMATFLNDSHYDILLQQEDVNVYKPNGEPLLFLRTGVLPASACKEAWPALRKAATSAGNRGIAAGIVPVTKRGNRPVLPSQPGSQVRVKPIKEDGTLSNTNYALVNVPSGIIGYYDRVSRFPYCRTTAFNLNHPEKFAKALPLFQKASEVFRQELPERWQAQMEKVRATSQDFVIHDTCFTTITINRNWQTAVHQDVGDLKEGFGVMCAFRAGKYHGGYLVFPQYRVAVDLHTRDLILADVHCWHGNTALVGVKGAYERLSLVMYYRENMIECGSASEERDRAKNRKKGDPLHGK